MSVVNETDSITVASELASLTSGSIDSHFETVVGGRKKKSGKNSKHEAKSKTDAPYTFTCYVQEHYVTAKDGQRSKKDEEAKPIYGVAFSPYLKSVPYYFATACGNRCTIYRCPSSCSLDLVHCYVDSAVIKERTSDAINNTESFYCCVWLYDKKRRLHLVAAAGETGIIRVLSPSNGDQFCALVGHGSSINDMCVHPLDSSLLLSASKDHTLRLWNIRNQTCIAIFGGFNGHRDQVVSCDFDVNGEKILSGGLDHTVKIWNVLQNPKLDSAINKSNNHAENSKEMFQTIKIHQADYSTSDIHTNYVDCARFIGDLIVSKSCENIISLWKPGDFNSLEFSQDETNAAKIRDYSLPNCTIWFVKFAIDNEFKWLAAGNVVGHIHIWSLTSNLLTNPAKILKHQKCKSCIRQLAFSPNGKVLLAVCDDGTIWRWDLIEY